MFNVILLIVFIVIPAIVLHELAHGFSAWCLGDSTAKDQGRLTINPLSHIDPVGSILVPGALFLVHYFGLMPNLMLFGWAKPVPVNFRRLRWPRGGMALVALAGPLTNILLAFIFSRLYIWPVLHHYTDLCAWGVLLNLSLAVFNMVPIPPLDGSRVVTCLLPGRLAYYYSRLEPYGIFIVMILLNVGLFRYLTPLVQQVGYWIGVQI